MKQTFGKFFLILSLTTLSILANVTASVSSPTIYKGDIVNFIITAEGSHIKFPQITNIEDNPIIGSSSSESISMINGDVTRSISKTYNFRTSKSLTIPSFVVITDGKEYKTQPIKINVVKPTANKKGAEFMVELSVDKNESYVGEPINLTIAFKSKLNARADQIQLGQPKLDNFWVKKSDKVVHSTQGDYAVQSLTYKLFPQKAGEYTIPATETLVGKIERHQRRNSFFDDPFFNSMTQQLSWQKVYSNTLKVKINPLPNGLELYGKYQIQASVDKRRVQANKPVNLTISVKGEGNIDDVKKFDLTLDNVLVYADEPKISSKEVHGIYQGVFSQKIALIGDQNFTIPSLSLEYFDKDTKHVKHITTQPIEIEVIGGEKNTLKASTIEVSPSQTIQSPPKVETKVIIEKEDAYLKYLFLAIGFLLGVGTVLGIKALKSKSSKQEPDIIKAIRKAKDDQSLFKILLPYAKKSPVIAKTLNRLEENLYRNGKHKIEKEALMEVFEEGL